MKSCPTCNRTYADETLTFCLVDGSILSAPYDPQATQQMLDPESIEPQLTEVLHSTPRPANTIEPSLYPTMPSPLLPAFIAETKQRQPEKRTRKRWPVLGGAIFLLMIIGLVIMLNRGARITKDNSVAKPSETASNIPNSNVSPTSGTNVVAQSTPTPESTPSVARKFDMMGTWVGKFYWQSATLVINSQEDKTFSGTLSSVGDLVAISGYINHDTRQLTMKETRVLKQNPKYRGWSLGVNNGSISSDGKKMNGKGKDRRGVSYPWSFSKK